MPDSQNRHEPSAEFSNRAARRGRGKGASQPHGKGKVQPTGRPDPMQGPRQWSVRKGG